MVRRAFVQRSLVEVLLPDGDKLWDPVLRSIDEVLTDDALVDHVVEALGRRHRRSRQRGRPGTPAVVILRMLVLKHLFDWSFDECEREVRANLVYRAFCRIEGERVPDAKTLIRLARVLDGPTLKQLLARLVAVASERRVVRGRRLRVDTTVVETNIHYPTDSTLLADGVRVLTRTLTRLRAAATDGVVRLRDRTRSVARRVFAITQLSRQAKQEPVKLRMRTLYRARMGHTRAVVRHAETAGRQVARGTVRGVGLGQVAVEGLAQQLRETTGLVRRVLTQTRARILSGNTALSRQAAQPLRAAHRGDPQGEGGEADGVRQAGEDPGSRGPVHHRLRGLRDPRAGSGAVGALADPARGTLRPGPTPGRGRWWLCLPDE
jgi:IS5 family transposase